MAKYKIIPSSRTIVQLPISKRYEKIELESMKKSLHNTIRNIVTSTVRRM